MGFFDKVKNGQSAPAKTTKDAPKTAAKTAPKTAAKPALSGFAAKLQAAKQKTEAPEEAEVVEAAVVPPDAPRRDSAATVEDLEATSETETPKKRGRPKGSKKETTAATSPKLAKKADVEGSIIYVDCLPVKGGEDVTTLEDWFGPISMELNEWAQTEKNLTDYRLAGFSEEKAALARAVQNHVERNGLPPTLLVTSGGVSRDLLALLVPHAAQVVRALR